MEPKEKEVLKDANSLFEQIEGVLGKNKYRIVSHGESDFEVVDMDGEHVCTCRTQRKAELIAHEHEAATEFMALSLTALIEGPSIDKANSGVVETEDAKSYMINPNAL